MCCMSFEHHMYGSLWKSLPNPGSKIRTNSGTYMIDGVDLSSESVRIRCPDGRTILVKTEDFPRFRDTVSEGKLWEDEGEKKEKKNAPEGGTRTRRPLSGEVGGPFGKTEGDKKGSRPEKKRQEQTESRPESSENAKTQEGPTSEAGAAKKRRRRRKKSSSGNIPEAVKSQPSENSAGDDSANSPDKNQSRNENVQKRRSNSRKRRPPRDKREQTQHPQDQAE